MIAALLTLALLSPAVRDEHVELGVHADAMCAPWNGSANITFSCGPGVGSSARLVFGDAFVLEASSAVSYAFTGLVLDGAEIRTPRRLTALLARVRLVGGWRWFLADDLVFSAGVGPSADLVPRIDIDTFGADPLLGPATVFALRWRAAGSLWIEARATTSIGLFPRFGSTGDVGISASWAFGKLQ